MKTHELSGSNWRNIRLELAETHEFPRGSASRAYMLHLPLHEDGTIDEGAFDANPVIAACRRFWPNEPDRRGSVIRTDAGWALAFQPSPRDGGAPFSISMDRLLPGDQVVIEKQGGGARRFRVVDLSFGAADQVS